MPTTTRSPVTHERRMSKGRRGSLILLAVLGLLAAWMAFAYLTTDKPEDALPSTPATRMQQGTGSQGSVGRFWGAPVTGDPVPLNPSETVQPSPEAQQGLPTGAQQIPGGGENNPINDSETGTWTVTPPAQQQESLRGENSQRLGQGQETGTTFGD